METQKRYWVCWYDFSKSKYLPEADFEIFQDGWAKINNRNVIILCAIAYAPSEDDMWTKIAEISPHYEKWYCTEVPEGWTHPLLKENLS